MTSLWLQQLISTSLPDHCTPTTPFLHKLSSLSGTCIPTPLAFVSSLLGTLSIVSWLFAQLPQIYKNYALQSTAGLSVFFLVEWCLGDSANLAGAILTKQAGWQITIACYYVFVDVVLVSQFFWYSRYKVWQEEGSPRNDGSDERSDGPTIDGVPVEDESPFRHSTPIDTFGQWSGSKYAQAGSSAPKGSPLHPGSYSNEKQLKNKFRASRASRSPSLGVSPHTVVLVSMLCAVLARASPIESNNAYMPFSALATDDSDTGLSTREVAGTIISWISTFLYLGSRLPQLYKNHCRKSTAGLSPLLFIAAFCGNFFYSSSMLTNPNAWSDFEPYGGHGWAGEDGNVRLDWIARAAPFWLGAAGVLALDGAMGVQFWMYGEGEDAATRVKVHVVDERGQDSWRWRRVSGWMRGWIPSVSTSRAGESEALMASGSGNETTTGYGTV